MRPGTVNLEIFFTLALVCNPELAVEGVYFDFLAPFARGGLLYVFGSR